MLLSDAVSEFERLFTSIIYDHKAQFIRELPITWSGGRRTFEETPWALFANKDDAIVQWLDTAKSYADGKSLKWIVKPELIEYMITIADQRGQHRAVNNRFTVKSQFVVEDSDGAT